LSGRGLCDELITRPEESYRLCCVVVCDLETSRMGAPYLYIYMTLVAYGLTIKGARRIYKNEKVKLEMGTKRKSRRLERREYGVYYELE